jgi:hypothetical protein
MTRMSQTSSSTSATATRQTPDSPDARPGPHRRLPPLARRRAGTRQATSPGLPGRSGRPRAARFPRPDRPRPRPTGRLKPRRICDVDHSSVGDSPPALRRGTGGSDGPARCRSHPGRGLASQQSAAMNEAATSDRPRLLPRRSPRLLKQGVVSRTDGSLRRKNYSRGRHRLRHAQGATCSTEASARTTTLGCPSEHHRQEPL